MPLTVGALYTAVGSAPTFIGVGVWLFSSAVVLALLAKETVRRRRG